MPASKRGIPSQSGKNLLIIHIWAKREHSITPTNFANTMHALIKRQITILNDFE